MIVSGLYAGRASVLAASGQRSGIVKQARARVRVTPQGILGDEQVDRRYHGGPEQALHQFALAGYAAIVAHFPALADVAVPGSLGENLGCAGLDEETVCIGDVYAFGAVELEVSQPRRPCTKIDARYAQAGVASWLVQAGTPGWYYRVRRGGDIALGDPVALLERPNPGMSLSRLLGVAAATSPPLDELHAFLACVGLGADWRRRLTERLAWLTR